MALNIIWLGWYVQYNIAKRRPLTAEHRARISAAHHKRKTVPGSIGKMKLYYRRRLLYFLVKRLELTAPPK